MEMAYRERWEAEIAEMRRVLAGFAMKEACKWGKPTYTVDGKNIVIRTTLLRQTVGDARGANQEGNAGDIRRQRVPGETLTSCDPSGEGPVGWAAWRTRLKMCSRSGSASPLPTPVRWE